MTTQTQYNAGVFASAMKNKFADTLALSRAPATKNNYSRAWRQFCQWAGGEDALPADATELAVMGIEFLEARCTEESATPNGGGGRINSAKTLKQLAAGLRHHGILPPADDLQGQLLKGLTRKMQERGAARSVRQATAFRAHNLVKLAKCADPFGGGHGFWSRDCAFVALSWLSLGRAAEILALRRKDLRIVPNDDKSELPLSAEIVVGAAKNLAVGKVRRQNLLHCRRSRQLRQTGYYAFRLIGYWLYRREEFLDGRQLPHGLDKDELPLFCNLHHSNVHKPLTRARLAICLARLASHAGLNGGLTGHSARRGAAQDLADAGFTWTELQAAGGWKSVDSMTQYLQGSDEA